MHGCAYVGETKLWRRTNCSNEPRIIIVISDNRTHRVAAHAPPERNRYGMAHVGAPAHVPTNSDGFRCDVRQWR